MRWARQIFLALSIAATGFGGAATAFLLVIAGWAAAIWMIADHAYGLLAIYVLTGAGLMATPVAAVKLASLDRPVWAQIVCLPALVFWGSWIWASVRQ